MTDKLRNRFWSALFYTALVVFPVAYLVRPGQTVPWRPLFFCLFPIGLRFAFAGLNGSRPPQDPSKRSVQGRWLDAPIAEVDKSTCGLLLANRWQKDPKRRIIASREKSDPTPTPHGELWDRDLDG